ncbi:MAG: hypothetical protein HY758_10240, partial [Nitrospirae bacterium]|nr:hypothetical protein [Nitrospirota bacterium]
MNENNNIFRPFKALIKDVADIGGDVKLFRVIPPSAKGGGGVCLDYLPGQFFMVSVWGAGDVPVSI